MRRVQHCPQSVAELDELASEPDRAVVETLSRIDGDLIVAGAGGKMGFHLALMLRRALNELGTGQKVIAISRFGGPRAREPFEAAGIETIAADLCDASIYADLPDAAAVFFLAGKKFGTSGSPEELRRVNEEMPSLVAGRYAASRIVAMSTGCVYPFVAPGTGGSIESDRPAPLGDYALSCLGRERAFLEASDVHKTPIALIRLNYSVDLRYGVLVDLAAKIVAGEPIDLTMGYFNCLWQGDAVAWTIRAINHACAAPEALVLNVTGSRILSVREVAESLGAHLNYVVNFSGEETETAWLSNAERVHRLFGMPRVCENTLIGWVAEWVGLGRPLLGKPTHFEVRDGRY
jgi:nucleoside-diphosphate-sugar epimerase